MFPSWYKPPHTYDWRKTLDKVCAFYKVAPEDVLGPRRHQRLIDARWVFAKALRAKGRLSYPQIARIIGNRDHTTIIHACHEFQNRARYRNEMHVALQRALAA